MKPGVFVRLTDDELAHLDALCRGESRPACFRRLLRDADGGRRAVVEPSASEALELLAAQARDGRTAAVVAYARILCVQEPDITARRVDQLIRDGRHAN
jgi:hypothetical protein